MKSYFLDQTFTKEMCHMWALSPGSALIRIGPCAYIILAKPCRGKSKGLGKSQQPIPKRGLDSVVDNTLANHLCGPGSNPCECM